jgi:tellurite resistance protein TehA-like permease
VVARATLTLWRDPLDCQIVGLSLGARWLTITAYRGDPPAFSPQMTMRSLDVEQKAGHSMATDATKTPPHSSGTDQTRAPLSDDGGLAAAIKAGIENLSPAYFALVMATGIISIALEMLGMPTAGTVLFVVNVVAYATLTVLSSCRAIWFSKRFFGDMLDHRTGPGFFTVVAASCIVGTQCLLIIDDPAAAVALLIAGSILWFILIYTIFAALTVKRNKPTLEEGITGAWLLAIVATQSVAVLSTLIAARWPQSYRLELNFVALSMWLLGGMLYIWTISLIFYRYTFFTFLPSDLSPPSWINMGAMAISVLAGTNLIENARDAPLLLSLLPFLKGFTVFYWATGTWWIPMLVLLGVWQHIFCKFPLRYDPSYWGAVFPLGMYTVCTLRMASTLDIPFLLFIPRYFIFVALAAWSIAFVGMLRHIIRSLTPRSDHGPASAG